MNNNFFQYAALSIILFVGFGSCKKDGVELAEGGKPKFKIVYAGEAGSAEAQSAVQLKSYLDRITGASFSIDKGVVNQNAGPIISLERRLGEAINPNEITIELIKDQIKIVGGSAEALSNGVWIFLEEFMGCKFFDPVTEYVPKSTTVRFPDKFPYAYSPEITTRTVHSRLFYEHPEFASKQKVTTAAFPSYVPNARVHTFHRFLPEETFYAQHPEFYALRNGKRIPTQLCLTNATVLDIVKDSVAALFQRNPTAEVISVSQDDNTQYCQCDQCAKIDAEEGSPSGSMIRFVNKVAEAFPQKTISTLAYQYTRTPSKTKPRENVLITLCSIECDRSGPIAEKCTDFTSDLIGWGALTDQIRIWDYTTQFTNFFSPFPNLKTLQPNIKLFRDHHAKWVFEQHSSHPSELFELRSYLTAKLLWNPDADVDELILEFTDGYYDEAGVWVRKYIELIHEELAKHPDFFLFLYGDPSQAFEGYLSPMLLTQYSLFFDEAESAVADKPKVLNRVKRARMGVDYAILEASKRNNSDKFSMIQPNENGKKEVNPMVVERLESFYKTAKEAEVTLMNEMGFTVDEYYTGFKKTLEVATKLNKATGKKVKLLTKPKKYAKEDPQVLTDGALGGNNFYANWLGFEGNDMEFVVDLEKDTEISTVEMAFLQVTNHIVFYPISVEVYGSNDGITFIRLAQVDTKKPLTKESKINEITYFNLDFKPVFYRYVKVIAKNGKKAPYWHHAADLPSWIFTDEIIIN